MNSYFIRRRHIVFLLCTAILGTKSARQRIENNEQLICNKYNRPAVSWWCKRISDCMWSKNILNTTQEHRCGSMKLCCPEQIKTTKKPSTSPPVSTPTDYVQIIRKKCEEYAEARFVVKCRGGLLPGSKRICEKKMDCTQTVPLVTNGVDAKPKEFPHMALIGYGEDINDVVWSCGGSLISENFVLSAAHCNGQDLYVGSAKWVALGILLRDEATVEHSKEKIFRIKKLHVHPGYKPPLINNDIVLLELEKPVTFGPKMRPICLNTEFKDLQGNATVTGWGTTAPGDDVSNALQKAKISFLPNTSCIKFYKDEVDRLKNGFDSATMVCAGDEYTNKDTCSGDSGGPIQINHKDKCMYLQMGITSFGPSFCGTLTPGIYTRVTPYLEWIQKIVWPTAV